MNWTAPDAVAAAVRRRWADGSLLRAYVGGLPFPVVAVPIRRPRASEIGDDVAAVQDWVARLDAGRRDDTRYGLVWTAIGGRHFGRNRLPTRAIVSTFEQAWALLGVGATVRRFEEILRLVDPEPPVRAWVLANPHRALELHPQWEPILAAYAWLQTHRGSGAYLREISAPGVDTKFAERHRPVLAALLGVPAAPAGFLAGLGLRTKPELMRVRLAPGLGLAPTLTEVAVRADELAQLPLRPRAVMVCENEITYLSVPVPTDGMVLWGKGFEVDRVGRLPWLSTADVFYWGDTDTHGFAILSRLRAWLPHTAAVLMDRQTLLAHRDRWGTETTPTRAGLARLNADEAALYQDLVSDQLGDRVRLEQERIDWEWARRHLPYG